MRHIYATTSLYIAISLIMVMTSSAFANNINAGTDAGPAVIIGKASNQTTLPDENSPMETQNAQCTIKAGNIEASAQASVSKKLEGICGSYQMKLSFEIIEARLMHEINQLKAMIYILLPNKPANSQYNVHSYASPYNQPVSHQSTYPTNVNTYEETARQTTYGSQNFNQPVTENIQPTNIPQMQHTTPTNNPFTVKTPTQKPVIEKVTTLGSLVTTTESSLHEITFQVPEVKSSTVSGVKEKILEFKPVQTKSLKFRSKNNKPGPRDFEVHKFNNTLLSGGEIRIFTYYWRFENFTVKLKSNASFIYSPIFSISGLNLRVKATLNHLNRDYLYLQLESVPHSIVDDGLSNIILETGDMFKEIETKKFFRHKIVIMDQGTPTSDLISQEFLNTKSGFPVPNSAVKSPPYAKDDNILIKVVIFL